MTHGYFLLIACAYNYTLKTIGNRTRPRLRLLDSGQVLIEPLQRLSASAAELQGPALVSRFLASAVAEWQQLKAKAETLALQDGLGTWN